MKSFQFIRKYSFRYSALTISLVFLSLICACAHLSVISKNTIDKKFDTIITNVNRNSQYIYRLKKMHIGSSGYFYVIGTNGRIVYHPKEALIGMSFMKNSFVKKMIEKRTGCTMQHIKPENRIIIFRPINTSLILCMSIDPSEVNDEELDCQEFKRKSPQAKN